MWLSKKTGNSRMKEELPKRAPFPSRTKPIFHSNFPEGRPQRRNVLAEVGRIDRADDRRCRRGMGKHETEGRAHRILRRRLSPEPTAPEGLFQKDRSTPLRCRIEDRLLVASPRIVGHHDRVETEFYGSQAARDRLRRNPRGADLSRFLRPGEGLEGAGMIEHLEIVPVGVEEEALDRSVRRRKRVRSMLAEIAPKEKS